MMVKPKMPGKKRRAAFTHLPVIVGITVLIVLAWVVSGQRTAADPVDQTLQLGSAGGAVATVQIRLNVWHVQPHVAVNGDFGQAAKTAVETFQAAEGLTVDGVVGPATWADLLKAPPARAPAITVGTVYSKMQALLNDGGPNDTMPGYYASSSSSLVAAAAGADNQQFYQLGELLVKDGLSNTIINLSREMNGAWYEWSERRAPLSEPNAFILAWRQVVTTMRSVPGEHFKFLWTLYPDQATVAESWPGSAYVDYVGTDIFDWYGGPGGTYPHTASGALNYTLHWQQTLTATPGGLNWIAEFSRLTDKPIIIPEWGLDFHGFGGQDDPYFLKKMTAWLKANNAIGLYWAQDHVIATGWPGGPLIANEGAAGQENTPGTVNGLGKLLGGHLQYAGVYLSDTETISDATAQPILAPWENLRYQLVLSVDIVPNPVSIKSYSGPPPPTRKAYELSNYPDAVAALRQGLG
jgi:Putative peptidoglycan binding domain/Glycosyl hydrolase family 26